MTPNERTVLDFIEAFCAEHRFAPSLAQIAAHMGYRSRSHAHRMVHSLHRAGHLEREGTGYRKFVPARSLLSSMSTEDLRAELHRREHSHG